MMRSDGLTDPTHDDSAGLHHPLHLHILAGEGLDWVRVETGLRESLGYLEAAGYGRRWHLLVENGGVAGSCVAKDDTVWRWERHGSDTNCKELWDPRSGPRLLKSMCSNHPSGFRSLGRLRGYV